MTARKNFKRGGKPLADAPSAAEAGDAEHRDVAQDERQEEGATIEGTPPRNEEGGPEVEGAPPHIRHPRSSPDPKKRKGQAKAAKTKPRKHARTGKAKSTTRAN